MQLCMGVTKAINALRVVLTVTTTCRGCQGSRVHNHQREPIGIYRLFLVLVQPLIPATLCQQQRCMQLPSAFIAVHTARAAAGPSAGSGAVTLPAIRHATLEI